MSNDGSSTCTQCDVNRFDLQRKIRQLTEKLEYSQLQNSLLSSECDRLRKELREAEFKGRSSVRLLSPPSLPDEVLHYIFSMATHFDGLASRHWDSIDHQWKISSLARRSIPAVCRKWHKIGLKFLYQHIVLSQTSQITRLFGVLANLSSLSQEQCMEWVHSLEFIIKDGRDERQTVTFADAATRLLLRLPASKLRKFGLNCGECCRQSSLIITNIAEKAIRKAGTGLEVLHLPCLQASPQGDWSSTDWARLSTLQTLSLTGGVWGSCLTIGYVMTDANALMAVGTAMTSICTLFINCNEIQWYYEGLFLQFLESAVHLETMHIIVHRETPLIGRALDRFLSKVPRLKRLFITPSSRLRMFSVPQAGVGRVIQVSLEEITVDMSDLGLHGFPAIRILEPLVRSIMSRRFPNLLRIIIKGNHQDGCLDAYQVCLQEDVDLWEKLINWCSEEGIAVNDQEGHAIHLWHRRHAIRCDDVTGSNGLGTEDDEWQERSESSDFSGSHTETDDDGISDDSEDSPYRYVRRPDLEWVGSDSEEALSDLEGLQPSSDG
ncbi:hypothetical protein M408DRAFT_157485 [Serendipita vermifera MAFF 305830]|uniref:Uncharacterized protein n=1 Tax=Serendipita vermifera MAFF 305830 TaxID=933852 RepID=A0A0C3B9X0_SERVB|nr:hypothetical protein M408DRAFT_157485 [Serendipita vermifera MAFF 305830]